MTVSNPRAGDELTLRKGTTMEDDDDTFTGAEDGGGGVVGRRNKRSIMTITDDFSVPKKGDPTET